MATTEALKKRGRKPSPSTQLSNKIADKNKVKEYSIPSGSVHVCTCCGQHATKSSLEKLFYMSLSPFHAKSGRVPICKECVRRMSTKNGSLVLDMFLEVLRVMDKPYLNGEFESAIRQAMLDVSKDNSDIDRETIIKKNPEAIIGYYMKNIMLNYKESTWMDGDAKNTNNPTLNWLDNGEYESIEIEYLRERWGENFTVEDLKFLEEKYNEWESGYEVDTKSRQLIVENLASEELYIFKERQQGKDVSKRLKNIKDLMGLGNLSPKQETASEEAEFSSFPVMIAHIEKNKPAYVENHALKDIDNMGNNIKILEGLIARTAGKPNQNTTLFDEEYEEETMDLTSLSDGGE